MKAYVSKFSVRYQTALHRHLHDGGDRKLAEKLGREALANGLEMLTLVRVHEEAVGKLPSTRSGVIPARALKEANRFFARLITPIEETHRPAREVGKELKRLGRDLGTVTTELAFSHIELQREILRREAAEKELRKSGRHYNSLLAESKTLQEELRSLSHQILSAQEEERKKISRELHDEIVANLNLITLALAGLVEKATGDSRELSEKIVHAQGLVQDSVEIIHRFARDLRPPTLDDLGLIPALHSFTKSLSRRSGIRVYLRMFAGVEALDGEKKTVIYRVTQEALTNVAKHANATSATVNIEERSGFISLDIKDDGASFKVDRVLSNKKRKGLGLLGMRERVEMVGGDFKIKSAPGAGTTIQARIPIFENGKSPNRAARETGKQA